MKHGLLITLTGLLLLLASGPASAGTYTVTSCGAGVSSTPWTQLNSDPASMQTGRACGAGGTNGGLHAQDYLGSQGGAGGTFGGNAATFTLSPPPGTAISALTYSRYMDKTGDDGAWKVQSRAGGSVLEECAYDPSVQSSCSIGANGGASATFSGLSATSLSFGIWCDTGCGGGFALHSAHMVVYSTSVTINDPIPPDQVAVSGVPAGWQHATVQVTAAGRDALGIKQRDVMIDGVVRGSASGTCDYTSLTPCTAPGQLVSGLVDVDTTGVSEGTHAITVRVTDAAGNTTTSAAQSIKIDNQAPAPPATSRVGGLWAPASAARQVSVPVPAQTGSPIIAIHSQVCQGATCTSPASTPVSGPGEVVVDLPGLGSDGAWSARTSLVDEAGNESSPTSTPLNVDSVAPTGTLGTAAEVVQDSVISASVADLSDPGPSSGEPTALLGISDDGAPAVPFAAGSLVAQRGHVYTVTAQLRDPAGNERVLARTVTVIPRPPATTPTTPTTPTTLQVTPVQAQLRVDTAIATARTITVNGRAATALKGRLVTVKVAVRTSKGVRALTARGRVRSNARWTAKLSLPKGTMANKLKGRTVRATTPATSSVLAGSARRLLSRR